ncbi:PTS sugar transporter subunit IIC [Lysinibacillus agricola]|uniref:PTS sugar transporter subunit IIC n=1 Tax=Lysinibacillus agricola TaxID=2590012 RepID=A0ABX7AL74_9BACI|nr:MULTISPECIES: PTS sugar transporter subunit IIC [Lysinibacillus]KOS63674.1 PTS N-acetylgalactosameine transporter subunit IIC [Lysinibacillus sp. FJAT-14222]QQP10539.1 PTS sugar transporter subunit IIC [Lysinibacillus agricola]
MDILLQAVLVALFVTIAFIDSHTLQTHIFRPIFTGPVVGLIMGDVTTGLAVGVTIELMFLAVIFVGTATPPDPTLSTAIATGIAILGGGGTELAVATALPVSFIGQIATTFQNSVINIFFMHRAERAITNLNTRGLVLNNTVYPMLMNSVLYGIPAFLAIYFGADFVKGIIEAIPEKLITGLAVGGGLIGAVGFALLLSTIQVKKFWPFLFLGFLFASYLEINMIGIALLGVICVALYYYLKIDEQNTNA